MSSDIHLLLINCYLEKSYGFVGQHWFNQWLVFCLVPNHYLNQCFHVVNWSNGNQIQWNFKQNAMVFVRENILENVVCNIAVLSSPHLINVPSYAETLPRGHDYHLQHFDTRYLVFYNTSPPRMFLSLDLLWEYRIQHGANGPLYVTSSYSTWLYCRGVSGFATDCPCGVWCRGLTTCLLHVGPPFGNRMLNNSWAVGLT